MSEQRQLKSELQNCADCAAKAHCQAELLQTGSGLLGGVEGVETGSKAGKPACFLLS